MFLKETLLLGTILMSSLLGSLHCVGMCGALACAAGPHSRSRVLYHVGRLTGYVIWGAIAGMVGGGLTLLSPTVDLGIGIAMSLLIVFSGMMVFFGGSPLHVRWHLPVFFLGWLGRQTEAVRGLLLGLGSAFLPCGWLWTFVLSAAVSGSVVHGMLRMFVFWLGTVPALIVLQLLWSKVGGRLPVLPRAFHAVALILLGLMTLVMKVDPVMQGKSGSAAVPICHPGF